ALEQEDRHLSPGDEIVRAEVAAAASDRDAFGGQRLDPGRERRRAGHVGENTDAGRRYVADAVLGLHEEDGHLLSFGPRGNAVVAAAHTDGDRVADQSRDVSVELLTSRAVQEIR